MKNFIKWLFSEEETPKNENLNLKVTNGKIQVNETEYNPVNFLHVSIIDTYILNRKLSENVRPIETNFKTKPEQVKKELNHKFNYN
jgi:hypothetical protein